MTHPRAGRTIRESVRASNRHLPANNRHRPANTRHPPANNRHRPAGTTPPAGHGTAIGSPRGQVDEATSAGGGATLMTVAT
jgi:hypothetical protein